VFLMNMATQLFIFESNNKKIEGDMT